MIQHNDWTRYSAFLISRTFVEWFSDIYFPTLLDHFPKSNHQYILQWNIISSRQNTLFLFTVCKKMLNVKISLNGGNNFTNCILHIYYKRFILGVVEWSICQSFFPIFQSRDIPLRISAIGVSSGDLRTGCSFPFTIQNSRVI